MENLHSAWYKRLATQHSECTVTKFVHFKIIDFMLCEFHLNENMLTNTSCFSKEIILKFSTSQHKMVRIKSVWETCFRASPCAMNRGHHSHQRPLSKNWPRQPLAFCGDLFAVATGDRATDNHLTQEQFIHWQVTWPSDFLLRLRHSDTKVSWH